MRTSRLSLIALSAPGVAHLGLWFGLPLAHVLGAATADAWRWMASPYVLERIAGAAGQATLSTLLTFALAAPLAWLYHRRSLRFSRLHMAIHAAPFVLPVFVVVNGIREVFGAGGWIDTATGVDVLDVIGPLGAVVLAHAYYNYGFAARLLHAALEKRSHRLEEAAATLGAAPRRAFAVVALPLLAPSMAATALLVWLFSFTSFGVVLLLGGPGVATVETMMYQNIGGIYPAYDRAAALGIVQVALNVAVLAGYFALLRRTRAVAGDGVPAQASGRGHRWAARVALAAGAAPALAVLAGSVRVRGEWTLAAWRSLVDVAHPDHPAGLILIDAVANSVLYAIVAVTTSLALALSLAYGLRGAGRLRGIAAGLAALPLGTSSVLLGVAYVLAFGAGSWWDLRGTSLLIMAAHSIVVFPFAARVIIPAVDGLDSRLDAAAATLGARPMAIAWRVHLAALRPALAAAAGLAAAFSLGDFGATLILTQLETASVAAWVGIVDEPFRTVAHAQSVALSALLLVLTGGAYLLAERALGRPG